MPFFDIFGYFRQFSSGHSDARPMVNAKVNMAGGKGHESDKFYENMRFAFKGIENIHKMRKSLEHLTLNIICEGSAISSMESFITELANSGMWLRSC